MNSWDYVPRNGTYDSCERTYATLRVVLETGGPAEVTQVLGVEPTRTRQRGEEFTAPSGAKKIATLTYWVLSTEGMTESPDLRDHLDLLLSKLDERIYTLQEWPGVRMGVNCVWESKGSGGPCISSEQTGILGRLRLECAFDFYYSDWRSG